MNMPTTDKHYISDHEDRRSFDFVSRILAEILGDEEGGVVIHSESEGFCFDPEPAVLIDESAVFEIKNCSLERVGRQLDISILGGVQSQTCQNKTFTMTFSIIGKGGFETARSIESVQFKGSNIFTKKNEEISSLHDSLFELTVYSRLPGEKHAFLGSVRGFLIFSSDKS
jgi:hypothetical protein